jgi:hypothetical protein
LCSRTATGSGRCRSPGVGITVVATGVPDMVLEGPVHADPTGLCSRPASHSCHFRRSTPATLPLLLQGCEPNEIYAVWWRSVVIRSFFLCLPLSVPTRVSPAHCERLSNRRTEVRRPSGRSNRPELTVDGQSTVTRLQHTRAASAALRKRKPNHDAVRDARGTS